ncbi:MAG TPA: hypothetical protein DCG57_05155 [Candidatus Riflebacteria bacterium]|jgi:hypothetical protein|nr:hypothetical protein [Candidatus Riflebacteria bacterium]
MLFSFKHSTKQGSVLVLAVFIAISLTILSLSYFRMMRAVRNTDHRLGQQFVAREISLLIREEAMLILHNSSRDQRSQLFWFLLGAVAGAQMEMRLPFAAENISRLIQPGYTCEFSSKLKVVNFISYDHRTRVYASSKEGHGVLSMFIEVSLIDERSGKKAVAARETLHTQYEYLISSAICLDSAGSRLRKPLLLRRDNQVFDEYSSLQVSGYERETSNGNGEATNDSEFYNQTTLWTARNLKSADLRQMQIIDAERKIVAVNGIFHCPEHLEFDGDWQIKGKGVLVADSFNIRGALKKSSVDDLLVLFARKGKIVVDTDAKIEAALMAINRNYTGTVEAKKQLDLSGMLLADYLNLDNWSNSVHKIDFDKAFAAGDKAYQINISPWVTYQSGARN